MKRYSILLGMAFLGGLPACSFNFELTSQRTALENQVMGSYRELDDDMILASSVRGGKAAGTVISPEKKHAIDAREDQEFNRDDIDELKDKGLIGETASGTVALLPKSLGGHARAKAKEVLLATRLVDEENHDRATIWRRIITSNENLTTKDLPEVRRTYAKMQRDQATPGQWLQDDAGHWKQKPGIESLK